MVQHLGVEEMMYEEAGWLYIWRERSAVQVRKRFGPGRALVPVNQKTPVALMCGHILNKKLFVELKSGTMFYSAGFRYELLKFYRLQRHQTL